MSEFSQLFPSMTRNSSCLPRIAVIYSNPKMHVPCGMKFSRNFTFANFRENYLSPKKKNKKKNTKIYSIISFTLPYDVALSCNGRLVAFISERTHKHHDKSI